MNALDNDYAQKTGTTSIAIIAIVSALALFGVLMVTVSVTMQLQEAEAKGCTLVGGPGIRAFNASNGRCFHP